MLTTTYFHHQCGHVTKCQCFDPDARREIQPSVHYEFRERYGNTKVEHLETKCEECCTSDNETDSSNSASYWEQDQRRIYGRVPDDYTLRLRAMVQKSLHEPNVIHKENLGPGLDVVVHTFIDKGEGDKPDKLADPGTTAQKTPTGLTSADGGVYLHQGEVTIEDIDIQAKQEPRKTPQSYAKIVDDGIAQAVRGEDIAQNIQLPDPNGHGLQSLALGRSRPDRT